MRPPKPTALKALEGGRGHRTKAELAVQELEPHPSVDMPAMPKWLDAGAKKKWRELAEQLNSIGVLTVIDGDVLACYCQACSDNERYTRLLREQGETCAAPSGYAVPRPEVSMRNRARDDMRRFGAELGIGPASRTKIHVKKKDERRNPLDEVRQRTKR